MLELKNAPKDVQSPEVTKSRVCGWGSPIDHIGTALLFHSFTLTRPGVLQVPISMADHRGIAWSLIQSAEKRRRLGRHAEDS